MTIQSIVFPKRYFTGRDVVRWIQAHGYQMRYGIDSKENVYRVRQENPDLFLQDSYHIMRIGGGVCLRKSATHPCGVAVMFVVGQKKTDRYFFRL